MFVTGGNGSGKTTTMRVLTGLYFSTGGELRLNGKVVGPGSIETYRQSFAAIFSDFHAFRKPYALPPDRLPVYDAMLREMRIRHKLPEDLSAGYDPVALSTGQRKRLALALAIAEDRSIFIFDEWAADQDPQFREIFYHKIIPDLAAAGKAVLAVTHDDRYFGVASRRFHMEDGQISLVTAE
ncbi:MAG: ATP-binding cassette domain-containing protein [Acetobacteraceae bacterium]